MPEKLKDAQAVAEYIQNRLPEHEVSPEVFPSGNYMIDVRGGDDLLVLEARSETGPYGVSKNPELFAGAEAEFSDPDQAVDYLVGLVEVEKTSL